MTPKSERPSTSEILAGIAGDAKSDTITLGQILESIDQRAFGILLIIAVLPSFIPVPVGAGAISGPLAALLGLQMLIGLDRPWLPRWIANRAFSRSGVEKFMARVGKGLHALEKLCKPRWLMLTDGALERLTGLLLIVVGIALSLPIPFTNYPLGAILLAAGIALTERDGIVLAVCWVAAIAMIATMIGVGDALFEMMRRWF